MVGWCLGALLLAAFASNVTCKPWKHEDGIIVMTDNNFIKLKKEFPEMLIEFYAPWCKQCQTFAPEWSKAQQILEDGNKPMKLAKVDATKHEKLTKYFKIEAFPTVRHLKDGILGPEYDGGRMATDIVEWVDETFLGKDGRVVIHEYSEETSQAIFGTGIKKFVFIVTNEHTRDEELLKEYLLVAPSFLGEVVFVHVASEHRKLISMFGIFTNEGLFDAMPIMIVAELITPNLNGGMRKLYFAGQQPAEDIERIVTHFVDQQAVIPPKLRSAAVLQQDTEGPLTVIRAASFDDLVINNNLDVLVLFCTTWNDICKQFAPIYQALAGKLGDKTDTKLPQAESNLVISFMDNEANELDCTCLCTGRNTTEDDQAMERARIGAVVDRGGMVNRCGLSTEEAALVKEGEVIVTSFPTVYLFKGHSTDHLPYPSQSNHQSSTTTTRFVDAKYVHGKKFKQTVKYSLGGVGEGGGGDMMEEAVEVERLIQFLKEHVYHPFAYSTLPDSSAKEAEL